MIIVTILAVWAGLGTLLCVSMAAVAARSVPSPDEKLERKSEAEVVVRRESRPAEGLLTPAFTIMK
jgi:hypothetical protein